MKASLRLRGVPHNVLCEHGKLLSQNSLKVLPNQVPFGSKMQLVKMGLALRLNSWRVLSQQKPQSRSVLKSRITEKMSGGQCQWEEGHEVVHHIQE